MTYELSTGSEDRSRKHGTWVMIYGVVLVVLGALAIGAPVAATLAVELFIGWLLLIGGVVGLVTAISGGTSANGFWWNLITAVVYVLAGGALLWSPIVGALTLTVILAAYLFVSGIGKIALATQDRHSLRSVWGWMAVSGVIDLVLGAMIAIGLPGTGLWVLGLLVGINLVFTGLALVMAAFQFRRLGPGSTAPRMA